MKTLFCPAAFSRQAGTPIYGKRTERAVTSIAPMTQERAKEIADGLGVEIAVVYHAILSYALHEDSGHAVKVTKVYLERKQNNCMNSEGTK